ncbi:hypothetical protein PG990_003242 [Apiospora arundinis]
MASSTMPEVDLSENRQPDLYASSTIPMFFALLCVVLRFWCRWNKKAGFWLDDWLILCATLCGLGLMTNMLWWIPRGLGRHVQTFGPNVVEDVFIGLFTAELTYTGVIVFVKFSILALYWRIFRNSTSIKIPIAVMGSLVMMWGIAVFFLTLLQCIPTRGFWDKSINASCNVDSQKFLFAISIPNILIDVAILSLPVPYVKKLNVSTGQRRLVLSMFLLGGFVCIASVMRLVAVTTQKNDADVSWNIINQGIWAVVEADFAIISACLPTLRPVWLMLRPNRFSHVSSNKPSSYHLSDRFQRLSKRRAPRTWGASILETKGDDYEEEDTKPFSAVPGTSGSEHDRNSYVQEPQGARLATVMSSPIDRRQVDEEAQDAGAIQVHSEWGVQYSQRKK